LIRHANFGAALAVVALTITVVELPLRALLMFAVGFTALLAAGFLSTTITAITVATITTAADEENGPTAFGRTEPLAKDSPGLPPHPHPIAGWTSGPPS
jgi:hypothetical protein